MTGILLDSHMAAEHINAMDGTFTLRDVIYIMVLLVGAVLGYSRMQSKTNENKVANETLKDNMEKEFGVIKLRIDKTQERLETDRKENQKEFKGINKNLHEILGLLKKK